VVIHLALVPITGASVNPARSIASAVIGGDLGSIWIYIVGPVIGAVAGWAVYRALLDEPARA
jgi:glycerol uptake facilitator-like aquaporin